MRTRYSPVRHSSATKTEAPALLPFDLHVLSLPLAFILSQDQTLHSKTLLRTPIQNQGPLHSLYQTVSDACNNSKISQKSRLRLLSCVHAKSFYPFSPYLLPSVSMNFFASKTKTGHCPAVRGSVIVIIRENPRKILFVSTRYRPFGDGEGKDSTFFKFDKGIQGLFAEVFC